MRLLWHNAGRVLWGCIWLAASRVGVMGAVLSLFGCTGYVWGTLSAGSDSLSHCVLWVCTSYSLLGLGWVGLGCSREEAGACGDW